MSLTITYLNPKELIPYEGNIKPHTDEQIDEIVKSIQEFSFDQPIVVNEKLEIIKGHGRTLASIKMGLKEVPVIIREGMTQAQQRIARVVDNTLQSTEWEAEDLRGELLSLKESGDLNLSGFTEKEIPKAEELPTTETPTEVNLETKHECPSCEYKW